MTRLPEVSAGRAALPPITQRYLLCLNVKCYRDRKGRRYFDDLWQRDLVEHMRYLTDVTLACPWRIGSPPERALPCDGSLSRIRFVDLPLACTLFRAFVQLPVVVRRLWREVGRSEVVHLGVAGWPIPFGWIAAPIAILRRKPFLLIIESAPWRLYPGTPHRAWERAWAWLSECCSRFCANHAQLVIVTQEAYGCTLRTRNRAAVHVIPASWVHEEDLISADEAATAWRLKGATEGVRLLFAGRLVRSKGVELLLGVLRGLSRENAPVEIDILGDGELSRECEDLARRLNGRTHARMLGTVPYGGPLFRLLRAYHAVLVPSFSDEQPRIVYDAFSQAVPVLANRTAGLQECIEDGRTGAFAAAPDVSSWVELIRWSSQHLDVLERMGIAALQTACGKTHRKMHEQRWQLLLKMHNGSEAAA